MSIPLSRNKAAGRSVAETARKNVGTALAAATKAGDVGAQIRYLTALGIGLVHSKMYEQALPYFENALKISAAVPDAGYQFLVNEVRVTALIGLNRIDTAKRLADEILIEGKAKSAHFTRSHCSDAGCENRTRSQRLSSRISGARAISITV